MKCRHPDGCERPGVKTRSGWCRMHGARIYRSGDPGPAQAIKGQPRSNGKDRPEFGDNTYKGTGRLVCTICGRPFNVHAVAERCYEAGPL